MYTRRTTLQPGRDGRLIQAGGFMRVLAAGAGVGGLTVAFPLRRAGLDADVYEQAEVLRAVGAGLTMGPNAVKILHRLGLAEAFRCVT